MKQSKLIPVIGAVIRHNEREQYGIVKRTIEGQSETVIVVEWYDNRSTEHVALSDVRCGLKLQMVVQDVPRTGSRKPIGEGTVVDLRELGGREQVLVDFPLSGTKVWLPWEILKPIRGVEHSFLYPRTPVPGGAERFRLRCLAYALELWNENTGALSSLEVDPLPHQIHLVHHILASGNLNWLIADDVGLGKTIEVGMLLAALKQRGSYRRILIITPAGLTSQWQQELDYKFGMGDFQIYGIDFHVNDVRHWRLHNHVIGSIDLLKREEHKERLLAADPWDIVIFDEAHRLSRRQWGRKFDTSDRFRLAAELRVITDSLLLLSGTPHQGMPDKFQALLELLRPELQNELSQLELNPEILGDLVIRNRKADVTDVDGNFIFKGKSTHAISVECGLEAKEFEHSLRSYLLRGYAAGRAAGHTGVAIGFVMTIYRKLAASSASAILRALERRYEKLREVMAGIGFAEEPADERFFGEWEEEYTGDANEFFVGELEMLEDLIYKAKALVKNDQKVVSFMENFIHRVLASNSTEKILIFSEYRATQECLESALKDQFGKGCVSLIHGGQEQSERFEAISHFETEGQFLISTEAGGEGINLHRNCHVLVNFDLPWNPMRLVQRIGRLYRYGQSKRVVVFNVHSPESLDADILQTMYQRITKVVSDMSVLGDEFNERMAEDIIGELSDIVELDDILENALEIGIDRTRKRIDEALARARDAVSKQRELFEHVAGYNPNEVGGELSISSAHFRAFIEGMFEHLGIEIVSTLYGEKVLDIRLPESIVAELSTRRSRWRVALDRTMATNRSDIHMLDLESPLIQLVLRHAKSFSFGGRTASISDLPGEALLAAFIRWQNEQGIRMRQEFAIVKIDDRGLVELNSDSVAQWLCQRGIDGVKIPERKSTENWFDLSKRILDNRLFTLSNSSLHPENREWIAAAWRG